LRYDPKAFPSQEVIAKLIEASVRHEAGEEKKGGIHHILTIPTGRNPFLIGGGEQCLRSDMRS
jgi:hypothetical protein